MVFVLVFVELRVVSGSLWAVPSTGGKKGARLRSGDVLVGYVLRSKRSVPPVRRWRVSEACGGLFLLSACERVGGAFPAVPVADVPAAPAVFFVGALLRSPGAK